MGDGVELVNRDVVVVQTDPKHERQKMDQEEGVEDDVGKGAQNALVDHANAGEISGSERDAGKGRQSVALQIGDECSERGDETQHAGSEQNDVFDELSMLYKKRLKGYF